MVSGISACYPTPISLLSTKKALMSSLCTFGVYNYLYVSTKYIICIQNPNKNKKTITITITTITTGQQKMISLCCTHLRVYFLLVLVVHVTNLLSDHQNHGT